MKMKSTYRLALSMIAGARLVMVPVRLITGRKLA
jgi:hypothetical protein